MSNPSNSSLRALPPRPSKLLARAKLKAAYALPIPSFPQKKKASEKSSEVIVIDSSSSEDDLSGVASPFKQASILATVPAKRSNSQSKLRSTSRPKTVAARAPADSRYDNGAADLSSTGKRKRAQDRPSAPSDLPVDRRKKGKSRESWPEGLVTMSSCKTGAPPRGKAMLTVPGSAPIVVSSDTDFGEAQGAGSWEDDAELDMDSDASLGGTGRGAFIADEFGSTIDKASVEMLRDAALQAGSCLPEGVVTYRDQSFTLRLDTTQMDATTRELCEIRRNTTLECIFDCSEGFRRTSPTPKVSVVMTSPYHPARITSEEVTNREFPLGSQLVQALSMRLSQTWPTKDEAVIVNLWEFAQERLMGCGSYCMQCGSQLDYPGAKPTICADVLCSYRYDQLGIGATLSQLQNGPVADLLVTLTHAAAANAITRPITMPSLPAGPDGLGMAALSIKTALDGVPSVAELAAMKAEERKARIGQHCETLLRWIFATNRAHIKLLRDGERIAGIGGAHQFKIVCSNRQHAASFEERKRGNSTFYSFHGSPIFNWHSVLRTSLKNLSNTVSMSTGATYGAGIYMSGTAATAIQYAQRSSQNWAGGLIQGDVNIIAIVECTDSPKLIRPLPHKDWAIAPDPDLVQLRYLIIGTAEHPINGSARAQDLAFGRVESLNACTFKSNIRVDDIPPARLWKSSDNYAFDIVELAEFIKKHKGHFINEHTHRGFCQEDVEAIIKHPAAQKYRLQELEDENQAAKRAFLTTMVNACHDIARRCAAAESEDGAYLNLLSDVASLKMSIEKSRRPEAATALARMPLSFYDPVSDCHVRETFNNAYSLLRKGLIDGKTFGLFMEQVKGIRVR